MKFLPLAFMVLCTGALLGCGSSGEDDLRQWMANERAQAWPRVTPIAEPKEPLEAFPLDTMAMVGSLNKTSKPTALLKVDNLLYQVQIGNYLGQNYGRITAITETAIQLREIVQDATGDWIERATSLELQEEAKK